MKSNKSLLNPIKIKIYSTKIKNNEFYPNKTGIKDLLKNYWILLNVQNLILIFISILLLLLSLSCKETTGSVTDIDGNIYKTIKIGSQIWMAENLKVTRYRNGDIIPNVVDDKEWSIQTKGAYCNYNNDEIKTVIYGRLYNWYAATDKRNIAPQDFHIPTEVEWQKLSDYLGGDKKAGAKMKVMNLLYWDLNFKAPHKSGFNALPAGDRNNDGFFDNIGFSTGWWTATGSDSDYATSRNIISKSIEFSPDTDAKVYGFSLRCVKD